MFFNKQPKIIKCAGCQQKIVGQYINALKKNWHSHCFVCDDCKQPILQKAFTVHKKKVYHQHCFQKKYGKVCAVCGLAINGRYLVNHWGDVYCLMHQNQASCFSCGKIISQRLTGGGVKYANHRYCCQQCHQTAILQARNLEKMKTVAISFLQSMGLKLDYQSIPIKLVNTIKADFTWFRTPLPKAGETHTRLTKNHLKKVVNREIIDITILAGLPEVYFVEVLIHEYGHCWLFLHNYHQLPKKKEEGFCVLLEYLWLQKQSNEFTQYRKKIIETNTDPIYGKGFQLIKKIYDKKGLKGVLNKIR